MPSCSTITRAWALSKPDFDRHLREPGTAVYGQRNHWLISHIDPVLLLLSVFLMAMGQLQRQMLYMGVGLVAMMCSAQIPPRMLQRWAWLPYMIGFLLLVGVDLF